jgi:hypothetical protein
MAGKYEGIEKLLGLPEGSTQRSEDELRPLLVNGVKQKTDALQKDVTKLNVLSEMKAPDLVKHGFDLESLEQDKIRLRNEAFEVYDISRALLVRFKEQIDLAVNPNDRMWASGAKLIDSVTSSIDKLTSMVLKFKQEEEMKGLALVTEAESTTKSMSPQDWLAFVKEAKFNDENNITDSVKITETPPEK